MADEFQQAGQLPLELPQRRDRWARLTLRSVRRILELAEGHRPAGQEKEGDLPAYDRFLQEQMEQPFTTDREWCRFVIAEVQRRASERSRRQREEQERQAVMAQSGSGEAV